MFYSHQLLARKAPLGQIWMAATLHAKINRRSLDKLNIIQICEEILNPVVPMALRLSGILMGGVVIVYERKVKLLYDDVNRLLVEINKVWRVKDVTDSTILPKGKTQAKYEAVTLPENDAMEIGDIERSLNFSTAATFQQTAYFSMRLDDVDINGYSREEEDVTQHYHQANPADITLFESFDTYPAETGFHNRFDRVDIEGDQGVQVDLTPVDQPQIPDTLIPSPPGQDDPKKGLSAIDEIGHRPTGQEANLFDESRGDVQPHQEHQRQGPTRRRARRVAAHIMDYKQTIIPGSVYQSWLQEASDIVSGRGRKRKRANFMSTMKISDLIKLSPIIFVSGLMGNGRRYIYYPTPLLELGMRRTESPGDSPSGISRPQPHELSSSSSPLDRVYYQDFAGFPSEDFDNGAGSQSLSIEKTRAVREEVQTEAVEDVLRTNLVNTGMRPPEANVMVTPGNSGDELRSIPSSGSGHGFSSHTSEIISGWKRAHSSSRRSGSSLETVAEENPWQEPVPHFKLARLSENGLRLTPEHELLVETGPTQTQIPAVNHPIDKITDSIRLHLKSHFDTPGAPQVESLDQLASGMNRKSAAQLFYQTSVLATHDFLRVQQKVPYGDILISRGAKM